MDEVTAAWALLDLSTLPSLHTGRALAQPLHGGPLARCQTLSQCGEAALAAAAAAATLGGRLMLEADAPRLHDASLTVTLRPVPPCDTAAALLPPLALAAAPLARVVSLYRELLAEALGTAEVRGRVLAAALARDRAPHGEEGGSVAGCTAGSSSGQPAAGITVCDQLPEPRPCEA